ncbi:hypothetical protein C8R44DRAFT_858151 [Mycena epipterygia]|nr:hypothetical protein C8R44DRAFT_858151 [Mycena epipterygia]
MLRQPWRQKDAGYYMYDIPKIAYIASPLVNVHRGIIAEMSSAMEDRVSCHQQGLFSGLDRPSRRLSRDQGVRQGPNFMWGCLCQVVNKYPSLIHEVIDTNKPMSQDGKWEDSLMTDVCQDEREGHWKSSWGNVGCDLKVLEDLYSSEQACLCTGKPVNLGERLVSNCQKWTMCSSRIFSVNSTQIATIQETLILFIYEVNLHRMKDKKMSEPGETIFQDTIQLYLPKELEAGRKPKTDSRTMMTNHIKHRVSIEFELRPSP